ncbi:TIGR00730 family Rossman fold protein [Candidatus Saccharibacteria bacterium]|nr:TIGR00730 family Rossman fold protein [Candidatus Saccharibacteria bacterium]
MTIAQQWMDNLSNDGLSIQDVEYTLHYARDLTNGLRMLKDYPQGVTVFGSARIQEGSVFYDTARKLGQLMAQNNQPVITGGGPGIMEAANRGAFEAGGISIGLNIELPHEQFINHYVTDSMNFEYFFARKVMLVMSAKAYVYMPGGFGTIDELGEILVLMQEGKMPKTPIFLVGQSFWQPLDDFFKAKMEEANGLIAPGDRNIYKITNDLDEIVTTVNQLDVNNTSDVMQAYLERGKVLRHT